MTTSSGIAFALVFLVTSLSFSMLSGIVMRLWSHRLHSLGAPPERRMAALALAGPPLMALALVLFLAADSAWSLLAGTDHCESHAHHLHLCLVHGADWAEHPWALAALAVSGTLVAARSFQLLRAHYAAQVAGWRFRRLGDPLDAVDRCFLLEIEAPVIFTIGALSPTVVVSRNAWALLDPMERRAVVEHELAHIENGDLWRRAFLGLAACFAAPGFSSFSLQEWDGATERICDRRAAEVVGCPTAVAGALVALARVMSRRSVPTGVALASSGDIVGRVGLLLSPEPVVASWATWVSWLSLGIGISLAFSAAIFSSELHHFFETILG